MNCWYVVTWTTVARSLLTRTILEKPGPTAEDDQRPGGCSTIAVFTAAPS